MDDDKKAEKIASILTTSFYHHEYTIGRKEAKELSLPVIASNKKLEDLIWNVWTDFETEMKCAIPFDPMTEVLTTPEYAAKFDTNESLPTKKSYENLINNIPPGGYTFNLELCHAAVESLKLHSEYVSVKQYTIVKTPDLKLNHLLTPIHTGYWRREQC